MELPRTIGDFEARAAELLDPGPHGYYAGGACDELTLRANVEAWQRITIRPVHHSQGIPRYIHTRHPMATTREIHALREAGLLTAPDVARVPWDRGNHPPAA